MKMRFVHYIFFASFFMVNTQHAMNFFAPKTSEVDYAAIVKMMLPYVASKQSNFHPIIELLQQLHTFITKQKTDQKAGNLSSSEDLTILSTKIQCALQKLRKINAEIAIDTIIQEEAFRRPRLQVILSILQQALQVGLPDDPEQCQLRKLITTSQTELAAIHDHLQILQAPADAVSQKFYTHVTLPQLEVMRAHDRYLQSEASASSSEEDDNKKIADMLDQHQTILSNAKTAILGAPPSLLKTLFSFSRPSKTKPDILGNPLLGTMGLALAQRPALQKYRRALQVVSLAQLILGPASNFNKRIQ